MELIDEIKDMAWLLIVVIIPLVGHNVKLHMNVKTMMRVLDADKINAFNGEWAVAKDHISRNNDNYEKLREDVKDLYQRTEK